MAKLFCKKITLGLIDSKKDSSQPNHFPPSIILNLAESYQVEQIFMINLNT